MAFHVLVLFAGVVVGWIRKGSLWAITNLRLKMLWTLPIAYVLQHVSVAHLNGLTYQLTIVVSYVVLVGFCLLNSKVPGIAWTFAGTVANFLVMCVNGLRMPAYLPAVKKMAPQVLPLLEKGEYGKSVAMGPNTHLNFLGDIFSVNLQVPSLISIGDILFAIGLIILIQHAMRTERSETSAVSHAQATESH